jgi:hypothetical protein
MADQAATTSGIDRSARESGLVGGLVVAGRAAGFAIHKSVIAQTDVDYRLAEAAEFFAFTRTLWLLALCAFVFGGTGSGAHENTVARTRDAAKMTLVIVWCSKKAASSARLMPNAFLGGL